MAGGPGSLFDGPGYQDLIDAGALVPFTGGTELHPTGGIVGEAVEARRFRVAVLPARPAIHVRARREVERLLLESERARTEAEEARADADAANRAKGEFLAVMSHELRTPLNAIGGYAELMEMGIRGPLNEQQRADLHRIQQSQKHLLGLINQVLNYTRVESGAVRYTLDDVPVAEAIATAEALVAPQIRAQRLTLAVVPFSVISRS